MKWGIEPSILLLFLGIFMSVGTLIYCEHMFKDDGQIFQVVGALVVGFSSALFTKLKSGNETTAPPPGSTTVTKVDQIVEAPKEGNNV